MILIELIAYSQKSKTRLLVSRVFTKEKRLG